MSVPKCARTTLLVDDIVAPDSVIDVPEILSDVVLEERTFIAPAVTVPLVVTVGLAVGVVVNCTTTVPVGIPDGDQFVDVLHAPPDVPTHVY